MLRAVHPTVLIGAVLVLSACAAGQSVTQGSGAALIGLAVVQTAAPGRQVLESRYSVKEVRVWVPPDLRVSEADSFDPAADIVWQGEPAGDRYAQVNAMVLDALGLGTSGMNTGETAIVQATVRRFRALSENTRHTMGGVHAVHFDLVLRDAATGAMLEGPRLVKLDIPASVGQRALEEVPTGRVHRAVIVEGLAQAIQRELSVPVTSPAGAILITPQAPRAPVSQGAVNPARDPLSGVAILQTEQMSL